MLQKYSAAESQSVALQPEAVSRPEGGYCLVSALQITMIWWAYKSGLIRLVDLRVWFACWELVSKRCEVRGDEPRRYEFAELDRLVGGGGGRQEPTARRAESIRRLERAGLISWSQGAIKFPASPDGVPTDDLSELWAMYEKIDNRRRRVPIPRRIVREIAAGLSPVVVSTILGHLFRCLYFTKQGGWNYDGCCKASFVADVFNVDERGVRRARKHLEGIGWLSFKESDHWHRQRYGGRAVINGSWSRPVKYESDAETGLPDRTPDSPPRLPCPVSEKELSSRSKNQEPASCGTTGVLSGRDLKKKPTMQHVELWDLQETPRLLKLFEDATDRQMVQSSEHGRLLFMAAAERALMKGTINPCGFFVRVVRSQLWHHVTQGDEDAAQQRLKQHFYGDVWRRDEEPAPKVAPPRVDLSQDARMVHAARRVAQAKRIRSEPFYLLRQSSPDWTRDRWNAAVDELERAQLAQLRANASAHEGVSEW